MSEANPTEPIFKVPPAAATPKQNWFSAHLVLGIVFILVVLAAIVAGIYYYQTVSQIPATVQVPVHKEKVVENNFIISDSKTVGQKIYTNNQFGFSFEYPQYLVQVNDKYEIFNIQNTPLHLELGGAISGDYADKVEGKDFATEGYGYYILILDKKDTDQNANLEDKVTPLSIPGVRAIRHDTIDGITRGPIVLIENPKDTDHYIGFGYDALCESTCTLDKVDSLFNQILSTFKFTDSSSRILLTPDNVSTYDEAACNTKFNGDPASTAVKYSNLKNGIELEVPYNPNWGNDKFKINPFDDTADHITFGPISPFEGCSLIRQYFINIIKQRTAAVAIKAINDDATKNTTYVSDSPKVKNINGITVVEYNIGEFCSAPTIEIVGKRFNYELAPVCGDTYKVIEDMVKTVKFID